MIVAIPIILLPIAVLWYLNIGGIFDTVKAKIARNKKK
jgi:hypothetical protein